MTDVECKAGRTVLSPNVKKRLTVGLPDYVIMGELYVLEGRESDFNTWRTSLAVPQKKEKGLGQCCNRSQVSCDTNIR